jgi:hypothetical protein
MERATAGEKARMPSRKGPAYGLGGSIGKVGRPSTCQRKVTLIERFDGGAFLIDVTGARTNFENMDEAVKHARRNGIRAEIVRRFGAKQPG